MRRYWAIHGVEMLVHDKGSKLALGGFLVFLCVENVE